MHDWKHVSVQRHFWGTNENGQDYGMYLPIHDLLRSNASNSAKEQFHTLVLWLEQGHNAVRVSWNCYECTHCGTTATEEFYTAPHTNTHEQRKLADEAIGEVVKLIS